MSQAFRTAAARWLTSLPPNTRWLGTSLVGSGAAILAHTCCSLLAAWLRHQSSSAPQVRCLLAEVSCKTQGKSRPSKGLTRLLQPPHCVQHRSNWHKTLRFRATVWSCPRTMKREGPFRFHNLGEVEDGSPQGSFDDLPEDMATSEVTLPLLLVLPFLPPVPVLPTLPFLGPNPPPYWPRSRYHYSIWVLPTQNRLQSGVYC